MKAIYKVSALALLATALTVSCEKEMNAPEEAAVEKNVRTFTLSIAQPDSKVAVTDEGKSTWEVGDEILIHGHHMDDAKTVALTADDISADGKTAKITVDMTEVVAYDPDGYYAAYPADAFGAAGNSIYYYAEFANTNRPLMAAYLSEDAFVFFNLTGMISYKVSGDFDSYIFSGNGGEAVGYTFYQVKINSAEQNYKRTMTGPVKSLEGTVAANGETVNYLCFPNGVKFTEGFSFKFLKDGKVVKTATTATAVEIPRNGILPLGDITSHLEDYEEPASSDHKSEITGATDLSASQANCFVISAPGAYKFPALKGSTEEAAGNVFGVELVWESCNNAEEVTANSVIAAVDFEDNWMYFKTPETLKPGNAVIAAKDVNEKIIWSWHIWIPETTIATATYGIFNHELMDRNLGALVAATAGSPAPVESFGLTYQWGRKDPFPGPAATSGSSPAAVAGTTPYAAAGTISLAESIANPALLGHTNSGDWLTAPDNTLWQDGEKTVYDPCPAGYKVVSRDKKQPLMGSDVTAVTGWNVDLTNQIISIGEPVATFPIAGYRDDYSVDEYAKIGVRVAYWTSYTSSDATGSAYHLNWRPGDASPTYGLGGTGKSRGCYVRCIKLEEAGEEPVEPVHTDVAVTLDGNMSEWDAVEAIADSSPINVWKYTSDNDNLYFYFKIQASKIKSSDDGTYKWRRYIYMGFDTDNNAATGQSEGLPGGLTITGCEANALLYPFRGSVPEGGAYPDGVVCVNGEDEESWVKNAEGTMSDSKITAYGAKDGDFFYLEIGVPRAGLGSPAAGKVNVQFSFSWDLTEATVITIK